MGAAQFWSLYLCHVSPMNLVNGLVHQESLVAKWSECPVSIWQAVGSILVGAQTFYLFHSRDK